MLQDRDFEHRVPNVVLHDKHLAWSSALNPQCPHANCLELQRSGDSSLAAILALGIVRLIWTEKRVGFLRKYQQYRLGELGIIFSNVDFKRIPLKTRVLSQIT